MISSSLLALLFISLNGAVSTSFSWRNQSNDNSNYAYRSNSNGCVTFVDNTYNIQSQDDAVLTSNYTIGYSGNEGASFYGLYEHNFAVTIKPSSSDNYLDHTYLVSYYSKPHGDYTTNLNKLVNTYRLPLDNLAFIFTDVVTIDTYVRSYSQIVPLTDYVINQLTNESNLYVFTGGSPIRNFDIKSYCNIVEINTSAQSYVDSAYNEGYGAGVDAGYQSGYTQGYNEGLVSQGGWNLSNYLYGIVDIPVLYLRSLFGFELFGGISLFGVLISLITMAIVIFVIKKFIK